MSADTGRSAVRLGALALGVVLFVGALYYLDVATALATVRRLGVTLALAVLLWALAIGVVIGATSLLDLALR